METNNLKLLYPAEGELEWYQQFVTLMNMLDEWIYGCVLRNALVPLFNKDDFTINGSQLTWSAGTIRWHNPFTNQEIIIIGTSMQLDNHEYVFLELPYSSHSPVVEVELQHGSIVPLQSNVLVIGQRIGDNFICHV